MDAQGEHPESRPAAQHSLNTDTMRLALDVRREGAVNIVALCGSVRLEIAEQLKIELPALVTQQTPNLIVDLSQLEFIGSVGIAAIVAAQRSARGLHGSVVIVNPIQPIQTLLRVTRVDQLIYVAPSLDAARARIAQLLN